MRLIEKHFKQDNILHKIFNRKTLKISYPCTKNISQIINSHNNELINKFCNRVNNNINIKKLNVIVNLEVIVQWMVCVM